MPHGYVQPALGNLLDIQIALHQFPDVERIRNDRGVGARAGPICDVLMVDLAVEIAKERSIPQRPAIVEPKGANKMSEIRIEFAGPFLDLADRVFSQRQTRFLVVLKG